MKKFILYFLIAALAVSTIFGVIEETISFLRHRFFYGGESYQVPGQKFLPAQTIVANQKEIGFIENQQEIKAFDLSLAQYIFAPTIVRKGSDYHFIIASGFSSSSLEAYLVDLRLQAKIVGEFPNQIFLLEK